MITDKRYILFAVLGAAIIAGMFSMNYYQKQKRANEFFNAVYTNDVKKTKFLLQIDAKLVNSKANDSTTPLCHAKSREITELLITFGADIKAIDRDGRTPLHLIASYGNKGAVESIISRGVDVNAKDNDGRTPLQFAVSWGNEDVVELLISKGADVNTENNLGETPLKIALEQIKYADRAKNHETFKRLEENINLLRKHGGKE